MAVGSSGKTQRERRPVLSKETWAKAVQVEIDRYRKLMRKQSDREKMIDTLDLTDAMAKRRKRAIVNTMEEIYRRYQPPEEERALLGQAWLDLNLAFDTYSRLDRRSHLLFGASIWMLDRICRQEKWRVIYPYLPTDESFLDDLCFHDVWHAEYEYELIYSVEHVLHNRNPLETDGDGLPRSLTSEYLAKRSGGKADREPDQNRKNYEAILSMLPQEDIDAAVERFREYFWQWVDRFFAAAQPFLLADEAYRRTISGDQQRLADMKAELAALAKKVDRLRKKKPVAPLLVKPQMELSGMFRPYDVLDPGSRLRGVELSEKDRAMEEARALFQQIDALSQKVEEEREKKGELEDDFRQYLIRMTRTGRITGYGPQDSGQVEVAEMPPMKIADPYEMCFALLYLIEADDDLPWLYGAGCGLMEEVAEALPWGIYEYEESEDDIWMGEEPSDQVDRLPKSITIPDWYDRKYHLKGEEYDFPHSLAQILYEETGCILPRNLHLYDDKAALLGKYGIRGKDAAAMLLLMTTVANVRRSARAVNLEMDVERALLDRDAPERKETEAPEALKEEIKRLQAALHASEKENREIKKTLAGVQAAAQREHRELADLREYVFNREEQEDRETEEVDAARWPYEVRKNTLVFGGHATWTKGIRSILKGNIRFIGKDYAFDTGIIKRAELIWIQPNALSHPMYYRIIDTARACNKAVRYFTFASWAKCGEQVVEGDGE